MRPAERGVDDPRRPWITAPRPQGQLNRPLLIRAVVAETEPAVLAAAPHETYAACVGSWSVIGLYLGGIAVFGYGWTYGSSMAGDGSSVHVLTGGDGGAVPPARGDGPDPL